MKKFQELALQWLVLQGRVRKECIKYLKKTLKKHNNHIECDDDGLGFSVSVTYDGENHPEYASNAFSVVRGLDLDENGNITLDIDDCPKYDIDDVNTDEVYDLCDFLDNVLFSQE